MKLKSNKWLYGTSRDERLYQAQAIVEEEANVLAQWDSRQDWNTLPNRLKIAVAREVRRLREIASELQDSHGLIDSDEARKGAE